jgi:hypothetical protein
MNAFCATASLFGGRKWQRVSFSRQEVDKWNCREFLRACTVGNRLPACFLIDRPNDLRRQRYLDRARFEDYDAVLFFLRVKTVPMKKQIKRHAE